MATSNPTVQGERIKKLMERVEDGDVKIPKFQRNFVWKQKRIINLLDSIYKGYPIGSLLFWCTKTKLKGERNIGGYELINTKDSYPTNYILDGQQRLTTIYSVFANRQNHPGMLSVFDISFDLNIKKFLPTNTASAEAIPLHALFENKEFHNLTKDFDNEASDLASELQETFMNYEVPIVTVNNSEIEEVAIIFERINSTAKTLTVFDLMVAATWSEKFDLRDEVNKLAAELKTKNFGDIDAVTLLKCFTVVLTGNQTRKAIFSLRELNIELTTGIQKAKYAIFRAVDFIATEFSCPSSAFLSYNFQIVLLTYFFANISIPSPQMIDFIKKWFWRSSFAERYQGANDTVLEKDIEDCKKLIKGETNSIFEFELNLSINKLMKTEFKKGTAFSNAIVCLLANNHPKNLVTGLKIDIVKSLSNFNNKEFHHVFPIAYLKDKNQKISANSVCNIVILASAENKKIGAKSPSDYFVTIRKEHPNDYASILNSNYLPYDDCSGIWENDYDFFIENRSEIILECIKNIT